MTSIEPSSELVHLRVDASTERVMAVVTSRTFLMGDDEAVLLPPEVAFAPDTEVTIVRHGDVITMYPARSSPAELVAALRAMPKPDSIEKRESAEIPERLMKDAAR